MLQCMKNIFIGL